MTGLKLSNYSAIALLILGGTGAACSSEETPSNNDDAGTGSGGTSSSETPDGGTHMQTPNPDPTPMGGATGKDEKKEPKVCPGMATGENPLIDDFDDAAAIDKFVPPNEGRNGWWEAFEDDVGTFGGKVDFSTGDGEGVDGSNARCVELSGHNIWGAVIAVNMGFPRCMYDATPYGGICFDAKGTITQGERLEFSLNTADTLGSTDGGRCDETDGDDNCVRFYHYKTDMHAEGYEEAGDEEVLLDETEYRTFCYTWEELQQDKGAPTPRDQNIEEVVQFEWKWPSGNEEVGYESTDGTLCVDNVRFMEAPEGMGGANSQ